MSEYDYVLVGSGVNALVAAAMLGKKAADDAPARAQTP
jgi:phytoene dehydrogenase-like protein